MGKKIVTFILLTFILIQGGCSIHGQKERDQQEIMANFNELLSKGNVPEIKEFLDKNIKFLSKEKATKLVLAFEEIQEKYLSKLESKYGEPNIQKCFTEQSRKDNKIGPKTENAELKELLRETYAGGYKVESAEGYFSPVIDYEGYKDYSAYSTSDIAAYIDLMAVESNQPPAKDAALKISWEEVLRRGVNQENFINQYQQSPRIGKVKQLFGQYLLYAFYGTNNTPLFNYDSKTINPEARKCYSNLSSQESDFLQTINQYFREIKKNNYTLTEDVESYRKKGLILFLGN